MNCLTNSSKACAKVALFYAAKPSRLGLSWSKGRISNISEQPINSRKGNLPLCSALALAHCEIGSKVVGHQKVQRECSCRSRRSILTLYGMSFARLLAGVKAPLKPKRSNKAPEHRLHSAPNKAVEPTAPMVALWHAGAVQGAAAHRWRSATQ